MDNPSVHSKTSIQRSILAIAAICAAIALGYAALHWYRASDPYIHSVLTSQSNPDRGRAIFEINCAACHGLEGKGLVGPSLHHVAQRRSELSLIHQVISGETPPMPMFQPKPQEMADLLEYLRQL
ncbi:c-type cytochrome [Oscillatoria sp. FACHB-1406]|uniref:c-type cytochrome n=1 Tax=Oscillatoria sp. FACHB-1406 TaxID=2692846 RepID=UPI001683159F|nr:cytochrome c [Oscillatoria sp. FACHB-1406]